jgi:hypothetical protein
VVGGPRAGLCMIGQNWKWDGNAVLAVLLPKIMRPGTNCAMRAARNSGQQG